MTSRISVSVPLQRARLRLARKGSAVQLSHLQQIDAIRRSVEKSSWPAARSGGKKPKVKIAFGPAISVGYESNCEYCDVELAARLDMKTAKSTLEAHLPEGYSLLEVKSVPRFFPSLEKTLNTVRFEIESTLLVGTQDRWDRFWAEKHFVVTKKKQDGDVAIDARPLVRSWKLEGNHLELILRFGPGRTLKPERIVQAVCQLNDEDVQMGTPECKLRVRRTDMYFEKQSGELAEI